ncbi:MAG: hypothetical protein LBG90_01930 [Spirochaetaceae bacterium]|jgi:hypothetical protein|nr:hypothetical protein [Spirochaetaceae bacterium]
MKKFLVFFIIIIVLGGAVFFFGWANFKVPVGSYGVMRSKSHGLDPQIIRDGEFRWVWYKLIPTNVTIQAFTPQGVTRSFETKHSLPSGAEYAAFAGFSTDFSYTISGTFSFTLNPKTFIPLLETQNITDQSDLDRFETALGEQIQAYTVQRLRFYMEDEGNMEEILQSPEMVRLQSDVSRAFPYIENFSCRLQTPHFPDFSLYRQFRALYTDYVEQIRDHIRNDRVLKPESRVDFFVRLDELTKYGELLTKYPILLQYLTLEKDKP